MDQTDRRAILADLFALAGPRGRVFGCDSATGRGGELRRDGSLAPGWWKVEAKAIDRACVEGRPWVSLPGS